MKIPLSVSGTVIRKTVLLLTLALAQSLNAPAQTPSSALHPGVTNQAAPAYVLPTDPLMRRTVRETHKWIANLNTFDAHELDNNGTLAFSWEELTASYPQQARILDDYVERTRLDSILARKKRSYPIPARLASHHAPDSVTIRKYDADAHRVILASTNGISYMEFRVPTKWPAESLTEQAETDRRASLILEKDAARAAAPLSAEPALQERLAKLIVPQVNWTNVPPADCVSWLADESRRVDPDEEGVNFVLSDITEHSGRPITLTLRNAPLIDIIKAVSSQSGWAYQIDPDAVTFSGAGTKPSP